MKGKAWMLRVHREDRGQALVELALVSVLLLLLLLGVVDFGRAFNNYIIITNAAREGARYASRFPQYAQGILDATIQEAENSGITLAEEDIYITPDPRDGLPAPAGSMIWVGVQYEFDTIMGAMIGMGTLTMRSATQMVVSGPGP